MLVNAKKISQKLTGGIAILIILSVCLCVTTFALVFSTVMIEDNIFTTGVVKINLNDEKPIVEEGDLIFEPGATVVKEFFIENKSTCQVYYKIYFDNVSGGLSDVILVTVRDGDEIIAEGKASELKKSATRAASSELEIGEKRTLTVTFHYPEGAGNETQNQFMQFDVHASAVQTKNNPDRNFE